MERSDDVASVSGRHNEMYLGRIDNNQLRKKQKIAELTHLSTTGMPSMGQMTPESNSVG